MFRLDGFVVEHKMFFISTLGVAVVVGGDHVGRQVKAKTLARVFKCIQVGLGLEGCLGVHGSSRNDFNGAMVYAASRPTRSEGWFNSASAKFFQADIQQTSIG